MTTSAESVSFEVARRALDELAAHELSPSVTNFAVWTAHLAGENGELSTAIDGLRSGPMRLSNGAMESLYFQFFVSSSDVFVDLGDQLSHQLRSACDALAEVSADTSQYGDALDGASTALGAPSIPPHVLEKLVGNLVQATRNMRERTRELEARIAQTNGEVSALRENLDRVREESLTDPLTGAANRKRFDEFLENERRRAERRELPLSLILCDIDHFKRVNDQWGHNTGDQVIRFIVSALQAAAAEEHLVSRFGGEEFAIVMPETSIDEAVKVAERARTSIESKVLRRRSTNEDLGKVTASFGVAQLVGDEPSLQLIERADAALYESKRAGRNRVSTEAVKAA